MRFNGITATDMGVGILLNISIPTKYKNAVQAILDAFKTTNEYEIKEYRQKRSLSANGLAWVYCDKLAEKLHSTKEDVYKFAVSHVGVFEEIKIPDKEAQKRFKRIWHKNGIGWLTKTLSDDTLLIYYGSSTYDTKQMARLIDFLQDECKRQGIETRPQWEVDAMLKEWK